MSSIAGYGRAPATIANGATESGVIDLSGGKVAAIEFPAAFTGATVTLKAADKQDGTFKAVVNDTGTAYSITVTANSIVALDSVSLGIAAIRFIKLVSVSAEGAARSLVIHYKS